MSESRYGCVDGHVSSCAVAVQGATLSGKPTCCRVCVRNCKSPRSQLMLHQLHVETDRGQTYPYTLDGVAITVHSCRSPSTSCQAQGRQPCTEPHCPECDCTTTKFGKEEDHTGAAKKKRNKQRQGMIPRKNQKREEKEEKAGQTAVMQGKEDKSVGVYNGEDVVSWKCSKSGTSMLLSFPMALSSSNTHTLSRESLAGLFLQHC